ncbi:hypothetical protein [Janthinobacterium sp. 17J80-10]|uniref:hypothetical protein n=1 Tax=Janthinobacterium sp. 17J80-10 TaxID=2497863 RepID=UPI0010053007|nr:hypothetical protein [Janthinobacterium sp. 17J80-10]QAU34675.1 hypothetical protein EKL02_11035 [Janthinobacterium sp. 17J80-10]
MTRILLLLVLVTSAFCAYAQEPIRKFGIVLLQPDFVLQKRVPSVDALANYIRAIEGEIGGSIAQSEMKPISSGFVVVAVRPGQKSNVWLDFEPKLPAAVSESVVAKIRKVQPVTVREGPVVFAIKLGLWGGSEPAKTAPSPSEWQAAAQRAGRPLETSDLVEKIWRD